MKSWKDAFTHFDKEAVVYWLKSGMNPESPDCKVPDPYSYTKRDVSPVFRCYEQLKREDGPAWFQKALNVFILLVKAGANIAFLHPSKSSFLFDLIKKTSSIKNYDQGKSQSKKEELALKAIQFLLTQHPAWINKTSSDGNSLLHVALDGAHIDVARYLIDQGADFHQINAQGDLPLHVVCRINKRRIGFVDLPSNFYCEMKDWELSESSERLLRDIILDLLKGGGPGNPLLVANKEGKLPLQIEDTDRFLWLLKKVEFGFNSEARVALWNAVWRRFSYLPVSRWAEQKRVLDELVQKGVSPNIVRLKEALSDHIRHTRINSYDASIDLIEYVLSLGVDVNDELDYGAPLLHEVADVFCYKSVSCATLSWLLENKADPIIKNTKGFYFIEMIGWLPGLKENKTKVEQVYQWMRFYPEGFLPQNAERLFLAALESECFDFASTLLDRGLKPTKLGSNKREKNSISLSCLKTFPESALAWIVNEERCSSMISADSAGQLFHHAVTRLHQYKLALLLLKRYSGLIVASEPGKSTLHYIAKDAYHEKSAEIIELVECCYELGLTLDALDSEGKSLLTVVKEKLQSDANMYGAYAVARVASRKTKKPFLSYRELDAFLAAAYKYGEHNACLDQLSQVYPKSLFLHMALKNAIDATNVEHVKKWLPLFGEAPIFIDLYEKQHLLRIPVFSYALKRLDGKLDFSGVRTHKEVEKLRETYADKVQGILLCLISKNCHNAVPAITFLNGLKRVISLGFSEVARQMLASLPVPLINAQLSDSNSYSAVNLIQVAATAGQADVVSALVTLKADIGVSPRIRADRYSNISPLVLACERGHVDVVKVLLTHKADPNEVIDSFYPRCESLSRALQSHDKKNRNDLVALLLAHGAVPQINDMLAFYAPTTQFSQVAKDQFYRAVPSALKIEDNWLSYAVSLANVPLVMQMLGESEVMPYIEARNFEGQQAIHMAAKKGNPTIFQALLTAKASLGSVDFRGNNALAYAVMNETSTSLGLSFSGGFDDKEMHDFIRYCVLNEKEFKGSSSKEIMDLLRGYAFKLFSLFHTHANVQAYIAKYRKDESRQPIHDLCQFQLPPSGGDWNPIVWADFVMGDPEKWLSYLPWAAYIEQRLKRVPENIREVEELSTHFTYLRHAENRPLAQLFLKYKIQEIAFNRALSMRWPKSEDHMPPLCIDGAALGEKSYYFKKLEPDDLRGFVLGHLTYCCQSVGSEGEGPTSHGLVSAFGGFYALFKRSDKVKRKYKRLLRLLSEAKTFDQFLSSITDKSQRRAYKAQATDWQADHAGEDALIFFREKFKAELEGQLVAQCWAWLSGEHELVFDSWEQVRRPEITKLCQPFLVAAAKVFVKKQGYKRVLLGSSGQTPEDMPLELISGASLARPKDYHGYRDSSRGQYLLVQAGGRERSSYTPLQATCMWHKTPKELIDLYDASKMKVNLERLVFDHKHLLAFDPLKAPDHGEESVVVSTYLAQLKQSMVEQGASERHGVVPMMLQRDYHTIPEGISDEEDDQEWRQIHWVVLGLSVYRIAESDEVSVSAYLLNPLMLDRSSRMTFDCPVEILDGDCVRQVYETGPWLLATVTDFLEKGVWDGRLLLGEERHESSLASS